VTEAALDRQFRIQVLVTRSVFMVDASTTDWHRMAREIAEELLELQRMKLDGDPYVYALGKLANNTQQPKLWRDVLSCLDELTKGD
jgi:hypothetical protein